MKTSTKILISFSTISVALILCGIAINSLEYEFTHIIAGVCIFVGVVVLLKGLITTAAIRYMGD